MRAGDRGDRHDRARRRSGAGPSRVHARARLPPVRGGGGPGATSSCPRPSSGSSRQCAGRPLTLVSGPSATSDIELEQGGGRARPADAARSDRLVGSRHAHGLPGHLGVRGRRARAPGGHAAPAAPGGHPARPAARPRAQAAAAAGGRARAAARHRDDPARERERRGGARGDRRRRARRRCCICAYGALVREPLLSEHDMLNVHPSLLPRWRGAAPIERAIEAGDEETGVTIMRPIAELDAGPICLQRAEPIRARRRLRQPVRAAGGARRASCSWRRSTPSRRAASSPTRASPTPRRSSRGDRRLDPARPADELERRVRALHSARRAPTSSCTAASAWACAGPRRPRASTTCPRARSAARRPAALRRGRRRARADRGAAAGRAADGRRRLAARPRRPGR